MVLDQAREFIDIQEVYVIRCLPLADLDANFKNLIIEFTFHFLLVVELNLYTFIFYKWFLILQQQFTLYGSNHLKG